ncbi:micrococcal nuclease (plasmid) [Carboxydocella thermautotrophica]|nr:micrococcal nuclease [Carboxydocella thermautotrophica]
MYKKLIAIAVICCTLLINIGCSNTSQTEEKSSNQIKQQIQTEPQVKKEQPPTNQNPINAKKQNSFAAPVKVLSVIDGDTIQVNLNGVEEKVRLIGVNTPETHHPSKPVEPYGPEAEKFTRSQLTGKQVYLEKDVQERDKYGRLLAYVWLEKPVNKSEKEIRAKLFNAKLLIDGYAQVMTIPPNVKYSDLFVKLQREARENNRGLWGIEINNSSSAAQKIAEDYFVGSIKSNKYHYPDCRWAKKILPGNLIKFDSPKDARKKGYEPCGVCNPPLD